MSIRALDTAEPGLLDLTAPELGAQTARGRFWGKLRRSPSALVGLAILALYVGLALVGPLVAPFDPGHDVLRDQFLPASVHHFLGTDDLGRDEFLMILYGARYTLYLGFLAVGIGLIVGLPLDAASGYFGGGAGPWRAQLADPAPACDPQLPGAGHRAGHLAAGSRDPGRRRAGFPGARRAEADPRMGVDAG